MPTLLDCGATIAAPGDAPGALIDRPRQIEYGGLLLGSGTPYRWRSLTGWDSMPAVDLSDAPRPADHGDTVGPGWFGPRMPMLSMWTEADTPAAMEQLLHLLAERLLYSDVEQPLIVRDTSRTLYAGARVVDNDIPHDSTRTLGHLDGAIQWKCSSPLRYLPGVSMVALTAAAAVGGLVYPLGYPLDYGSSSSTSVAALMNAGTAPAPAVLTFRGPAASYAVLLTRPDGTTSRLAFSLPLAVSDTLTVDTRTGSIRLNGTSDRTSWLTVDSDLPELWRIPPGTSSVAYAVTAAGQGTGATVRWTDTTW